MGFKVIYVTVIFSYFCVCSISHQIPDCPTVLTSIINCTGKDRIIIIRLKETSTLEDDVFKDMINIRTIDFKKNNSISTVNSEIFRHVPHVKIINLNHNSLHVINKNTFGGLPELRNLYISNNRIETIEASAFAFPQLQTLALNDNEILNISKDAFSVNSSIYYLVLKNNHVKDISFIYNLYNLSTLDCTSNNIEYIDENTFQIAKKVTHIECMNNRIENLKFLKNLNMLTYLDLSNNSITELPVTTFINTKKIQQILLPKNKLQVIPTGVFADLLELDTISLADNNIMRIGEIFGLPKLKWLNVRNNQLQSLPSGLIETSVNITLSIDGNHWGCQFIRKIVDKSSVNIKFTPRNNVTNYKNITCLDEMSPQQTETSKKSDSPPDGMFHLYIYGIVIFVVISLGSCGIYLIYSSIVRCRKRSKIEKDNIIYLTDLRRGPYDPSGYLEPRNVCQEEGIYEEIMENDCEMGDNHITEAAPRGNTYIIR